MSDLQALMPEGTQHLIQKIKTEKEDVFRLSTMPTASAENVGRIVQFIGTTSGGYTHGYFYECKENSGSYSWQQTDIQPDVDISGKEDKFRYTTMPTASESNLGQVVQYLGNSTQTYAQGNSYKCVAKGTTPETYEWVVFGGVKDSRISDEINSIKVRYDDGYRPYININPSTVIPLFEDATWDDISSISNLYYSGDISLEDIQEKWSVGDSKTISLAATNKTAAQNVTVKIVDFAHDDLTDADTNVSKALLTLGFELSENIAIGVSAGGWQNSTGRTFCNENIFNALPSELKGILKTIDRKSDSGGDGTERTIVTTEDKIFIPTSIEFINRNITTNEVVAAGYRNMFAIVVGTQYELYKTANIRSKTMVTSSTFTMTYSYSSTPPVYGWQCATSNNAGTWVATNAVSGFMPHFCI